MEKTSEIRPFLIAPCGMNCAVCRAHLRKRNPCPGCNAANVNKSAHCIQCRIKNCRELKKTRSGLCLDCAQFPCVLLQHLDQRYRTKYGMSVIENLETIQSRGMNAFVKRERSRWKCSKCGEILCVHSEVCLSCGAKFKKKVYFS